MYYAAVGNATNWQLVFTAAVNKTTLFHYSYDMAMGLIENFST